MKPEEFEVYVIPPNFMEGGTLFGGLLKTRNTIEAVILGLAVGVPVLHLPFSLTVRVVILCLTALPLVLLALIGVSGMSLSAFIRLFFCFLHNRRILSRDGTQGGKNGKTLLPSWAQQRKSNCEAEDPPLPKSRSRFSVDLKQRSVTQFKTFLQEEEAVQPLNALADYIPIEKIEHGVIYTRDHRYVKVVEVVPVNFLLRSAREQRSIIYRHCARRRGAGSRPVSGGCYLFRLQQLSGCHRLCYHGGISRNRYFGRRGQHHLYRGLHRK